MHNNLLADIQFSYHELYRWMRAAENPLGMADMTRVQAIYLTHELPNEYRDEPLFEQFQQQRNEFRAAIELLESVLTLQDRSEILRNLPANLEVPQGAQEQFDFFQARATPRLQAMDELFEDWRIHCDAVDFSGDCLLHIMERESVGGAVLSEMQHRMEYADIQPDSLKELIADLARAIDQLPPPVHDPDDIDLQCRSFCKTILLPELASLAERMTETYGKVEEVLGHAIAEEGMASVNSTHAAPAQRSLHALREAMTARDGNVISVAFGKR